MGSGVWLQLLLTLGALWGLRAMEMVLGILGQATLLQIPRQFQQRTRESREATWKKIMEEPQKKKFLLKISGRNYTELEPDRMRFHENDFSLEILNTSRDDQRLYEYSVSNGGEEEVWEIQLKVFEPVSHPNIHVLHRELSNGSCWLALRCSSEHGDEVSYSWDSGDNSSDNSGDNGDDNSGDNGDDSGTGGICSGSGAFLNLSYPVRSAAFGCVCTASNAVSNRSAAFDAAQCGLRHEGGPGVRTELLGLLVPLGVIVIVIIVVIVTIRATHMARGDQDASQTTPDSTSATIYAQVQKPKGIVPKATPTSCTTIYAAATGPLPAPDGAPRSPSGSPTPRGHSPLSQEPTTVYASVTLPVA